MNQLSKEALLHILFEKWAGEPVANLQALPPSGSDRNYFRISSANHSAIGAYNANRKENETFIYFSNHFLSKNIPVPKIYAQDLDKHIYLMEDLGNTTLLQYAQKVRINEDFPDELLSIYKKAIEQLVAIQIQGHEGLDYSQCYTKQSFDKQSILWDLNYFKYYFLKLAKIPFDEQALEDDFHRFANYLLEAESNYFLFRDFQARNVMLKDDKVYFIDYQGGRKGALQYDLAALLYQAKANIPHAVREKLLEYYLDVLTQHIDIERDSFKKHYYAYVLIRSIQVLGAYGFRGFFERKAHFLSSIPYAINNLKWLLETLHLPIELPALWTALEQLTESEKLKQLAPKTYPDNDLTVKITSFSYRRGIPEDTSGHGGGFVFDCRGIYNPGRYKEYRHLTGRDAKVIEFLEKKSNIDRFVSAVFAVIDPSIEKYLARGYTHLSVNFGCTGGQHRSVYTADRLAEYLKKKYNIKVELEHIEQEIKNWVN